MQEKEENHKLEENFPKSEDESNMGKRKRILKSAKKRGSIGSCRI